MMAARIIAPQTIKKKGLRLVHSFTDNMNLEELNFVIWVNTQSQFPDITVWKFSTRVVWVILVSSTDAFLWFYPFKTRFTGMHH